MSDFVSHFPRFNGGIYFAGRARGRIRMTKNRSFAGRATRLAQDDKEGFPLKHYQVFAPPDGLTETRKRHKQI